MGHHTRVLPCFGVGPLPALPIVFSHLTNVRYSPPPSRNSCESYFARFSSPSSWQMAVCRTATSCGRRFEPSCSSRKKPSKSSRRAAGVAVGPTPLTSLMSHRSVWPHLRRCPGPDRLRSQPPPPASLRPPARPDVHRHSTWMRRCSTTIPLTKNQQPLPRRRSLPCTRRTQQPLPHRQVARSPAKCLLGL